MRGSSAKFNLKNPLVWKMPIPYSLDLRWRIVWLSLVHGSSTAEIAQLFCISKSTVRRYLMAFRNTGEVRARNRRNGPQRLLCEFGQSLLLKYIFENPTSYLHEIQKKLNDSYGVQVSASTICRTLKSMGCSRQVIRHVALQQSNTARAKFMAEISLYEPSMLIWLDESACDAKRNSIRKFGYCIRGIRPVQKRLLIRGIRYSAIPVMSIYGLHDVFLAEGTITGDRFAHFVKKCLLPLLMPFNGVNPYSVVVMDNASVHHVETVTTLIRSAGAHLIFLPPYSPDLNPLEPVFGKVKSILKENESVLQVCSSPKAFLAMTFGMITGDDCINFSRHCGYM